MPRFTMASGGLPRKSIRWPSMSRNTSPASTGTRPMMHFISVLLPLPLVPSSTTVSPSSTSMDTRCNTRTAPYPASTSVSTSLFAKVGFLHRGVMHNLLRCALGDGAAGIEDNYTVGKTHHSSHNVFDHNDAHATCVERGKNG